MSLLVGLLVRTLLPVDVTHGRKLALISFVTLKPYQAMDEHQEWFQGQISSLINHHKTFKSDLSLLTCYLGKLLERVTIPILLDDKHI